MIYLEDSSNAEPVPFAEPQRIYDAAHGENMLQTADVYGRPLMILRIGSRVPQSTDGFVPPDFLYGCPPVAMLKPIPDAETLYEQGIFKRYEAAPSEATQPTAMQQLPAEFTTHSKMTQRIGDSR